MGVRGWRKISKVTDAWKLVLREPGSYMDRRATGERERENYSVGCYGYSENVC